MKLYQLAEDNRFKDLLIDREEERTHMLGDGRSMSYSFVHGSFPEAGVHFSFFIPQKQDFQGRFFQFINPYPAPDEEYHALGIEGPDNKIGFSLYYGAAYIESNMGIGGSYEYSGEMRYQSSAQTAELFRHYVMKHYDCARPYGYVFGGSGGSLKTMACLEQCDIWDGGLVYVIGSKAALPYNITLGVHAQRVLRNALPAIADALEPGGSNDPYAYLNDEEAACLREASTMGIPLRAWLDYKHMGPWALPVLLPMMKLGDPGFNDDFWNKPGYLGTEENSSAVRDRVCMTTTLTKVFVPEVKKGFHIESGSSTDDAYQKMISDGGGEEPA